MDIETRIKQVVMEKLGVKEEKITREKKFIEDFGADSLEAVDLIMGFEEEFQIEISEEDHENIKTVGQAIDYIKSMISQSVDEKIKKIVSKKSNIPESEIDINKKLEENLGIMDEINRVFEITLPEIDSLELTTDKLIKETINQLIQ